MQIGLSITGLFARRVPVAGDYIEPVEDPIAPPEGDPTPPITTPTDPETDEPEPGIDPDYTAPERIEVIEDNQGVIRTDVSPNTWAVSYVAAVVQGPEYCEIEIHRSTPRNATMAVGFTTLAMPLNGIPGELPGTVAWWSNGNVRQNGVTIGTLATWGRGDRLGLALDELQRFLKSLGCAALSSPLGDLSEAATLYPFIALYSTGSRARFRFSLSTFGCDLPDGFYPIGQVPAPPILISSADELDPITSKTLSGDETGSLLTSGE